MLILLATLTLALLFGGVALPRMWVAPPAFWAHSVLALGVMSLITAAMQHFVPVLCRGRGPGPWLRRLPWMMLAAAVLAVAVLGGWLAWGWIVPAALLAIAGALLMLRWMFTAARAALGGPHPGLAWYVAAMACLAAGLAAALLMPLLPAWHGFLRAFHVHINLYGSPPSAPCRCSCPRWKTGPIPGRARGCAPISNGPRAAASSWHVARRRVCPG